MTNDKKRRSILLDEKDEQAYLENRSKLQESNQNFYVLFTKIMIVLLLVLYLSTFISDYASSLMPIYLLFIGASLVELYLSSREIMKDERIIQAIICFGIGKAYLFCLLSSIIFNQNGPAITFHVFLILIPVAFIIRPRAMFAIQTGVVVLFCILTWIFKNSQLALSDSITVLLFYVISIIISAQITRLRINNVAITNLARKHSFELEGSQELLALALENADMNVWEFNTETKTIYPTLVSGEQKQYLTGFSNMPESAIEQGLICSDSIDDFRRIFAEATSGKRIIERDIHSKKPDRKSDYWVHIRLIKQKNQPQEGIRYVGTTVDITEQQKIKNEYQEQMKVLDSINDDHLITKGQWNLTSNRQLEVDSRSTASLLIESNTTYDESRKLLIQGILPEKKREEISHILQRKNLLDNYQKGITAYTLHYQRKNEKKDIIWVSMKIRLCKIPGSTEVVAFAYSMDNTDEVYNQKIIEKLVSEQFELLGTIIVETRRAEIRICNRHLEAFLRKQGVYPSAVDFDENIRNSILLTVPTERQKEILQKLSFTTVLAQLKEHGTYEVPFSSLENGRLYRKQLIYTFMDDTQQVVLFCRSDITKTYEIEQNNLLKMEESLEQAKEANAAKTSFLSNMSHDMRTPMNAILGFANLGLDTGLVETKDDYLLKIQDSGKILLHLINDTLDVSRIENGKLTESKEIISSEKLLESVVSTIQVVAEEKEINFSVEREDYRSCVLYVDSVKIQKIFTNILSNAIKFTPKGGHILLRIHTKERTPQEAHMVITVKDDGAGMDSDFLDHIFEPFMQEERTKVINQTGTGLGLSIVKSLIEFLGGQIQIKSKKDRGTEVTVKISLEYAKEAYVEEIIPQKSARRISDARILVCEDHPLNREITGKLLEKKGYQYDLAENGEEGVSKFLDSQEENYQMILMDIRMPKVDGLEATKRIRQSSRKDAKTIPILAMTANAFEQDVKECINAGMNAHLSKPIDPQILYKQIEKYLG